MFRHGNATPLLPAEKPLTDARYQVKGKSYTLQDYLKRQNVSGMLVLKNGKVAYKYTGEGNTDSTLWTSRSVGKSVVSALVGVAIKEGKIHSLDDLVTQYEPDLKAPPGRRNAKTAHHPHLWRGVERRLHQPAI